MRRTVVHYGATSLTGGATRSAKMRLKVPRGIPSKMKGKLRLAHKMLRSLGVDLALVSNQALESGAYYYDTAATAFTDSQDATYQKVPGPAPAYMWAEVRVPHKKKSMSSKQRALNFTHDLKKVSKKQVHQVMQQVFGSAYSWNLSNGQSIRVAIQSRTTKKRTSGKKPVARRRRASTRRRRTSRSMEERIAQRRRASSAACPMGRGSKYYKRERQSPPRPANDPRCRGLTICNSNGCWTSLPNKKKVYSWKKSR